MLFLFFFLATTFTCTPEIPSASPVGRIEDVVSTVSMPFVDEIAKRHYSSNSTIHPAHLAAVVKASVDEEISACIEQSTRGQHQLSVWQA